MPNPRPQQRLLNSVHGMFGSDSRFSRGAGVEGMNSKGLGVPFCDFPKVAFFLRRRGCCLRRGRQPEPQSFVEFKRLKLVDLDAFRARSGSGA